MSNAKKQGPLGAKQRWSLGRKQEVVLRLLAGEPLDVVSREIGVEVYRLEGWRDKALEGMAEGLRDRMGDPVQSELDAAKRNIGELSMEIELLRKERDLKPPLRLGRSRR